MLTVFFESSSNEKAMYQAAESYRILWKDNGEKIVKSIEEISHIAFTTSSISFRIVNGPSRSHPPELRGNQGSFAKKEAITHELCHILLRDNNLKAKQFNTSLSLGIHMVIDLILYDIFTDVWGQKFAREAVRLESKHSQVYRKAWKWATGFSKEQRARKFQHFVNKSQLKSR